MAPHADDTLFCLIHFSSSHRGAVNHPHNLQYVLAGQDRLLKRPGRYRGPTPPVEEYQLALKLDKDSTKAPHRGHYFGRDATQCDILLPDGTGISTLHFRMCLDYEKGVARLLGHHQHFAIRHNGRQDLFGHYWYQ